MTHRDRGKASLNYDEVLEYIGQFGWFQRRIFLLLSLVSAAAGLAVVVFAYTGFEPQYRCRVAGCEGQNSSYYVTDVDGNTKLPNFYANDSIELEDRCRIPAKRLTFPEVGYIISTINLETKEIPAQRTQFLSFHQVSFTSQIQT